MSEDKKIRDKLAGTEENDEVTTEDSNEQAKQEKARKANVKKFLWWIVGNCALQLLVGVLSAIFRLRLPSMSIVGLLIFQILFLFVLAECYELTFIKVLIDLILKSKRNL